MFSWNQIIYPQLVNLIGIKNRNCSYSSTKINSFQKLLFLSIPFLCKKKPIFQLSILFGLCPLPPKKKILGSFLIPFHPTNRKKEILRITKKSVRSFSRCDRGGRLRTRDKPKSRVKDTRRWRPPPAASPSPNHSLNVHKQVSAAGHRGMLYD